MALYKIADFIIDIQNRYPYIEKQCRGYKYIGEEKADYIINVTDDDIERERIASGENYRAEYLESVCAYRKLCLKLPLTDALLVHCSVIAYKNRGIAFSARSGVGKSTHTMLWKKVFGDDVTIINGDKPIVRFFDGVPYAYGTPWAGKEGYQVNDRVRLTDLCFIERSKHNSTESADKQGCVDALMHQILLPTEPTAAVKALELADTLSKQCNFWKIKCNISDEAAVTAQQAIFSV